VSPNLHGPGRKAAPTIGTRPAERRGIVTNGRIVKLFVGQGHGFIRLTDKRDVFFHRNDVREGTSINDFAIGDAVTFELLEDAVSGARALQVMPARRNR
jgi:cold shock CspA family protein